MTTQEWLATISPEEWMRVTDWLFHQYGKRWDNSYIAIRAWLSEEHQDGQPDLSASFSWT